jgi:glycerophosphoryl diester phosphodiesterase
MRASHSLFRLVLLLGAANIAAMAASPKLIIAHRGASGYLPEHTLAAKALAHAMGAHFLEQDVVLSRDDVAIVLHDVCLDTVTDVATRFPDRRRADGRCYAIDFTLAELKQLRVTERFNPKTGQPVFKDRFPLWQGSFEIPTLEEELQFIRGLNRSTGRAAGIYPEIKAPAWHRAQGKDISAVVLPLLARHGYRTKTDRCYLQCFDFAELKRIRRDLGYRGRLVQLLGEGRDEESGTDYDFLRSGPGLEQLARVADGIGPSLNQVVTARADGSLQVTALAKQAHALKLEVHPYTVRADALPRQVSSLDTLLRALFVDAEVDGVFMDHPDRGVALLRALAGPRRSRRPNRAI